MHKGRGLELKVNFFAQKLSNFDPVLSKLMQLKRVTEGTEPQAAGQILCFCGKK